MSKPGPEMSADMGDLFVFSSFVLFCVILTWWSGWVPRELEDLTQTGPTELQAPR